MLEFALEVTLANVMSGWPTENADQFKKDFSDRMRKAYGTMTGDLDEAARVQAICELAAEMGDRFIAKVGRREYEIRRRTENPL